MTTIADSFLECEVPFYSTPCPSWCVAPAGHVLVRRNGNRVACHRSMEVDGVQLYRIDEMNPTRGLFVGELLLVSDRGSEEADFRTQAAVERFYAAQVR